MRQRMMILTLLMGGLLAPSGWGQTDPSAAVVPAPSAAAPSAAPSGSNDLYSNALQAYLSGDFDQAILLDSKALQADPKDAKAQALLSLLVSEKDKANKSVIWIGHEAVAEAALGPVTVFREKVVQRGGSAPRASSAGLAQLEARVNAVAFLLERDSNSQYRELSASQAVFNLKLTEISGTLKDLHRGTLWANILFLLALLISVLALWKSWKNGQELKRRMDSMGRPGDRDADRIVQMRRM